MQSGTRGRSRRQWTAAVLGYVAVLGLLLQLRGALLPSFADAFAVSESRLGLVSTAASVGYLVAIVVTGGVVGRVDVRRGMLVGLLGLGGCLVLVGLAPTYPALLAGLVVLGVATGVLNAFDRPVLSHLYPGARARVFNVQDMVWAIGATVAPILAVVVLEVWSWRAAYLAASLTVVPLLALVWRLDLPETVDAERNLALADVPPLLRRPTVRWLGVAMLLLAFVESGIFTWLPYYASDVLGRRAGTLSLSAYLAAYVPARFLVARYGDRVPNLDFVLGAALVAAAMLAVAFVFADGAVIFGAILVVGFVVAGMFPTLLARGTNEMPEYSAPINAVALGSSSIGFMVFPAVMGVVAERYSVGTAMRLLSPTMLVLAALVAFVRVRDGAATDTASSR